MSSVLITARHKWFCHRLGREKARTRRGQHHSEQAIKTNNAAKLPVRSIASFATINSGTAHPGTMERTEYSHLYLGADDFSSRCNRKQAGGYTLDFHQLNFAL